MKTRKGDTKKSSDESWYYVTITVPRVFKKDKQLIKFKTKLFVLFLKLN